MSDEIAPILDPRVTRHCEFDTFVSRVDRRMQHASGLAIHPNAENVPNRPARPTNIGKYKPTHKSKFYIQQEAEMKDRKRISPAFIKNKLAKEEVKKELDSRLRAYQKRENKGEFSCELNINSIDIPPNSQEMAFFRYCHAMKNYQEPIYSDC